ncbi:MAG: hypothetical protein PHC31_12085 [Clostridia bacterium]|nr:hypothetical protein [Clostridia bacterium]MDD3972635.1 hypothetical protein [Clostridia bacterium]
MIIPDIRRDLDDFYDMPSKNNILKIVYPLLSYVMNIENSNNLMVVLSKNNIYFLKVFPDGDYYIIGME